MANEEKTANENVLQLGQEQPAPPVRFEIIPDELYAIVNLHDMQQGVNAFACWSFVSEGLSRIGQKELAILIKKDSLEADHDYPMDPLGLFLTVKQYAEQGSFVGEGDVTEFGDSGFIDTKFRAMAYLRPLGIAGIEEPGSVLSCVLLTEDELQVARRFGLSRILALLGYTFSHYPCPPWVDRHRTSVVDEQMKEDMDKSILSKVPQFAIPGVRVQLAATTLSIRCPRGLHEGLNELLKQIPDEAPMVVSTELDPDANALLVWQATMENGPSAITPPGSDGSKVCGCSVLIFPEQDESNAQVVEDSFLLSLTTPDWIKLRAGLMSGEDVKVETPAGGTIAIEWYEMDTAAIQTGADMLEELPIASLPESCAVIEKIELITEKEIVSKITSPQVFRQYLEAVEYTALGYFVDRKASSHRVITIRGEVVPGNKITWTMSATPDEDRIELKGIELRLAELPPPPVSIDKVVFELVLDVSHERVAAH
ncbi:MAG: DUF3480 domain-containing protein [Candidatus Melainabacteria bacterium]|nr:DUF3480 domain-containing protein [Candidatus Melainabacteria bacterium]